MNVFVWAGAAVAVAFVAKVAIVAGKHVREHNQQYEYYQELCRKV